MARLDVLVCVKLSENTVKKIDALIEKEKYYTRSDVLRDALHEFFEKTIIS